MSENRQAFERFISSPPFEKDIERFPTDGAKYPWPGAYCDITVELAWECWKEATSVQIARFESQLAEAEARIAELKIKEFMYDEHSDAVKKCLALNKQLVATEKALRWACNTYIVDDYYTGDLRKERLERAVNYAMKRGNLKKQTGVRGE